MIDNTYSCIPRYNQLQALMGVSSSTQWGEEINDLFSETFKKIANGVTLVASRAELENQINQCRIEAGPWTIEEKEIILPQDTLS